MSKHWCLELFVDGDSDFDLYYYWFSWLDSVEMTVFRLVNTENTVVIPQIFLFSFSTDCWKIVDELYWLKNHLLIVCAKFGGSALSKSGDHEL